MRTDCLITSRVDYILCDLPPSHKLSILWGSTEYTSSTWYRTVLVLDMILFTSIWNSPCLSHHLNCQIRLAAPMSINHQFFPIPRETNQRALSSGGGPKPKKPGKAAQCDRNLAPPLIIIKMTLPTALFLSSSLCSTHPRPRVGCARQDEDIICTATPVLGHRALRPTDTGPLHLLAAPAKKSQSGSFLIHQSAARATPVRRVMELRAR